MKREKRTVYLMPDLAERVDGAAAVGGISPSAIVETALDEHFTRESVYGAIEALTRRVGEMDERIGVQHDMLTKMETAIGAIGRAVVIIRDALKPQQRVEQPQPQPVTQERPQDPEGTGRGLLSGWRR